MPPTAPRSIQAGQSWAGQHCPEGRDWRDFPAMHFIFLLLLSLLLLLLFEFVIKEVVRGGKRHLKESKFILDSVERKIKLSRVEELGRAHL